MHRTSALLGSGILVAMLMSACRAQTVAPGAEIRALTQSLRVHGVTVRGPADLREEGIPEHGAPPNSRYLTWAGARVWVAIEACPGASDSSSCTIGAGTEFVELHPARVGGAELRRFESMTANRPRSVVWVTADRASERTVVLIIGRTRGDSALVRRMADAVQPSVE